MASSRELLKEWIDAGYGYDPEVRDSLEKMEGLTDELAEQRFLEKYGDRAPFYNADPIEDPTIPSMDNVIAIIGLSDDPKENKNPRTKEQKFIEDFPKKQADWKKKIVKNPVYGERGWETVKEIWRQAEHQKMLGDIAKARYDAVHDGTLAGFITRGLFPRSTEHIANSGDFTTKDILADIAENAAMSIPGAAFTGLAGRGLAKVAPRVVNWASKPGSNLVSSALKGAGHMSGNILGNAVVPFASEAMDAAIYGDDDEGMEQRADFSLGDALIGTAINQGVNRGIMRMAGPMLDRFSAGGLARGGALKARQFLETLGQSLGKKGDDFANSVAVRLDSPVSKAGEITEEAIRAARNGNATDPAIAGITRDEMEKAVLDQAVLDAIKEGNITLKDKGAINQVVSELKKEADDKIVQSIIDKGDPVKEAVDALSIYNGSGIPAEKLFNIPEKINIYGKPSDRTSMLLKDAIDDKKIAETLAKKPDEFINYATWHGQGPGSTTRLDKFGSYLNQAVPAWGVNKYGSEGDATMLLSPLPATKKAIDENRKEVHEAPTKRKMTKGAADVLKVVSDSGDLTEKDKKYLNAIAANPDILKYGYPEDSAAFKIWLLERGNDLLQGTSAFRPTFDVE